MYTFVFLWTPSLDPNPEHHPPLGLIFAGFMLAIMVGSTLFRLLVQQEVPIMETLRYSVMAGGLSLLLASLTTHRNLLLVLFFVFECSCGLFFPAMATLRGELLPEANRAGIMNW
jgi:MFS family permease